MATTSKKIIPGSQLGISASVYYTAPANTKCIVKKLTCTNVTADARLVTIYLVPAGGSGDDTNTISKTKTLAPYETWECFEAEGHVVESAGSIQALCDAATAVNIQGSGIELT